MIESKGRKIVATEMRINKSKRIDDNTDAGIYMKGERTYQRIVRV